MPLLRRIKPENWRPIGVESLEDNALDVVRSSDNRAVIAGPGAGKTELLAQRAAFLLQTGSSLPPRRILAISFKRDAATNIGTRVRKRCHPDHAGRFDSLTFDAFAKSLIDRFGQALPEPWRPRSGYEIMMPNFRSYEYFLQGLGEPPPSVGRRADIIALHSGTFERDHLIAQPLPADGWSNPTAAQWAVEQFWRSALHRGTTSQLSFPMIGRLAELLLRLNPFARNALRLTYSHLFMDEFQDTTQVQYDLVRTIFLESETIVTAVGDVKQQIMRWANAIDDPFGVLEKDFEAKRTPLFNNYRSSPELVQIQHILARALDDGAIKPTSRVKGTISGGSCAVWRFSRPAIEAETLADHIVRSMNENDLAPRDFVLLVRQKATDYADLLVPTFAKRGLTLRNESELIGSVVLQDLIAEEASRILILVLGLAVRERAGVHWSECLHALAAIREADLNNDWAHTRLANDLDNFARKFRYAYPRPVAESNQARAVVETVQNFVGRHHLVAAHPAYRQGDWLDKVTEAAIGHLWSSAANADNWMQTLDAYEGKHAVPLMTIHKSKGLEYHTVIFVGLDDTAWWSFTKDPVEGTAGFFVAFSRARQRAVFTYCEDRGTTNKIAPLYALLNSAGVTSLKLG